MMLCAACGSAHALRLTACQSDVKLHASLVPPVSPSLPCDDPHFLVKHQCEHNGQDEADDGDLDPHHTCQHTKEGSGPSNAKPGHVNLDTTAQHIQHACESAWLSNTLLRCPPCGVCTHCAILH